MDKGYAILGDVLIRVLMGWEQFEATRQVHYPEHAVIEGKPKIQYTGEDLEKLNLTMRMHIAYCDPDIAISILKDRMAKHQAMRLVLANGTYRGRYVLTELSETLKQTDPEGNAILLDARITLKEWAGQDASASGEAVQDNGKELFAAVNEEATQSFDLPTQLTDDTLDSVLRRP